MRQQRILVLCQHFYPEMVSTGLHMTELFTNLAEFEQNKITVFCTYPSKEEFVQEQLLPTQERYKNVRIYRVSNLGKQHGSIFQRLLFSISYFLKAFWFSLSHRKSFDLIIISTNPPFIGLIAYILKRFFCIPYILIVYDIYPEIAILLDVLKPSSVTAKVWSWFTKLIYNHASRLVVIGEDMRKIVMEKLKPHLWERIALIHNWADSREIQPVEKEKNSFLKQYHLQDKIVLQYSGTMGRTHNIEPILEAALELKAEREIVFMFVGGGNKKKIVEQFVKTHELNNIIVLPYQPFEVLPQTLSAATFSFVCLEDEFTGYSVPSKSYGIMASKSPIIGLLREDSEIADTIRQYDCGVLYSKNNHQSLSDFLLELLKNKERIQQMGENGYKAFLQHFDLQISVGKYQELIESMNPRA